MTQHLTPAAGREGNGFPRPRIGGNGALTADPIGDLGVRPGDSDPARMLSAVLLLAIAMIIIAVALVWWLT
jgi:hypothetical protein